MVNMLFKTALYVYDNDNVCCTLSASWIYFYVHYPITTKFNDIIVLLCSPKINCLALKWPLEFGFYRFTKAEVGVAKLKNKLDLHAVTTHIDIKFVSSSYYRLWHLGFLRKDRQTAMAISTRLMMLIQHTYI